MRRARIERLLESVLAFLLLAGQAAAAPIENATDCAPYRAELEKPATGPDVPVLRSIDLERRCRVGHDTDCFDVVSAFTRIKICAGFGDEVFKTFLDRACDGGCREACFQKAELVASGWSYEAPDGGTLTPERLGRDLGRALPLYRRACELGHPGACGYFGWIVRDGIGTTAHPAAGTAILVRSCYDIQRLDRPDGNYSSSCRWAAESFARGLGVSRDRSRARALLHVYCQERVDCDELYLISSRTMRYLVWALEFFFVVLANVAAAFSTTSRFRSRWSRGTGLAQAAIVVAGVAASILVGIELAYLFWGSTVSSPLWILVGAPLAAHPLVVAFRQRLSART